LIAGTDYCHKSLWLALDKPISTTTANKLPIDIIVLPAHFDLIVNLRYRSSLRSLLKAEVRFVLIAGAS
jgi:hypothetical protein